MTRQYKSLEGLKIARFIHHGSVKNEPGIRTVKENYGIFPSLSLLYVAGIPKKYRM